MLEAALSQGLLTYEIPERHWFFNLKLMTQTSSLVILFFFLSSALTDCPCSCFGKEAFGDAVTSAFECYHMIDSTIDLQLISATRLLLS
jgi:hypothetical protein